MYVGTQIFKLNLKIRNNVKFSVAKIKFYIAWFATCCQELCDVTI